MQIRMEECVLVQGCSIPIISEHRIAHYSILRPASSASQRRRELKCNEIGIGNQHCSDVFVCDPLRTHFYGLALFGVHRK